MGLILIFLFGIPRFVIVLEANRTANYNFTSLILVIMWLVPFLLLRKSGRKLMGIQRPKNVQSVLISFLLGVRTSALLYLLGKFLYQETIQNSFVYISKSYSNSQWQSLKEATGIFTLHFLRCLEWRLAFATVHLAHFGLLYVGGYLKFLLVPSILWMIVKFITSRLFFYCRSRSGSIYGANLCHAGFNLAMTYFIFYHML